MASRLANFEFTRVVSSPLLRARQTAEIVAGELKLKKRLQFTDTLACGGNPKNLVGLLAGLESAPKNVLLVGHEPYLSRLISLLVTGGADAAAIEMKKGGLCKLEADSLHAGSCSRLIWLLTPSQMELMA